MRVALIASHGLLDGLIGSKIHGMSRACDQRRQSSTTLRGWINPAQRTSSQGHTGDASPQGARTLGGGHTNGGIDDAGIDGGWRRADHLHPRLNHRVSDRLRISLVLHGTEGYEP